MNLWGFLTSPPDLFGKFQANERTSQVPAFWNQMGQQLPSFLFLLSNTPGTPEQEVSEQHQKRQAFD